MHNTMEMIRLTAIGKTYSIGKTTNSKNLIFFKNDSKGIQTPLRRQIC